MLFCKLQSFKVIFFCFMKHNHTQASKAQLSNNMTISQYTSHWAIIQLTEAINCLQMDLFVVPNLRRRILK